MGNKKAPALMTIGDSGVACFGRSEPQFREEMSFATHIKLFSALVYQPSFKDTHYRDKLDA